MATGPVSEQGDPHEHEAEEPLVAQPTVMQQQRIAEFVDSKAGGRHGKKPLGGHANRYAVTSVGQPVVPHERNDDGDAPTRDVGHQWRPKKALHQQDDDQPVHPSGKAADKHEPHGPAPTLNVERAAHRSNGQWMHAEPRLGAMLCLVVDDFGLHTGVNDAAQRLTELGRVHAVGALVGAPAFVAGGAVLRRIDAEGLDVGLHLDLTERPLLRRSSRPLSQIVIEAYTRQLDRRLLRLEICAQLDAFEAALGHGPAFVDGHQHVHQLPGVREALVTELKQRYGARLPWLRCTQRVGPGAKPWLISALGGASARKLADKNGFGRNRRLLGVHNFRCGAAKYAQLLANWLSAGRDGDLLMCHPALGSQLHDPLAAARAVEYSVLTGQLFLRMLQARGISLWPMSQILERLGG